MVSRSIRMVGVPTGIILGWQAPLTSLPGGFIQESSYFSKYPKNVINSCTNPGASVGAATHCHGSSGHTHTTSGSTAHTHHLVSNTGSTQVSSNIGTYGAPPNHTHAKCSCSTTPGATTSCVGHTHSTGANTPTFRQYTFVRKSGSYSLRLSNVPPNVIFFWCKPLACIPSNFRKISTLTGNLLKGTCNACTTPGTTGGNSNHIHNSVSHTHVGTLPAHTHTYSANWPSTCAGGRLSNWICGPKPLVARGSHTHNFTFPTSCSTTGTANTSCAGGHTHDTVSIMPATVVVAPVMVTSVSLRRVGIPTSGVAYWKQPLACIPMGFALQNGSNGTPNNLNRYHLEYPTSCTNPGTQAGNNCHTHSSCGTSHTHTLTIVHHHSQTGGASGVASVCTCIQSGCQNSSAGTHTHTPQSHNCCTSISPTICAAGVHTHSSADHRPPSIEVAFIQRL